MIILEKSKESVRRLKDKIIKEVSKKQQRGGTKLMMKKRSQGKRETKEGKIVE